MQKNKPNFNQLIIACVLMLTGFCLSSNAQNTVGGHFGAVQPIITFQDGESFDGFDPHSIGFPIGLTVRKNDKFAFDAEFVPFISTRKDASDESVSGVSEFIVHPGLLWGIGDKLTFGNRLAYELFSGRFGITPLINKGFTIGDTNVFAEFVLPIRFGADQKMALTAGIHLGVGF